MRNTSAHHIFPESLWGTRHHNNIILMDDIRHKAYHLLYRNLSPIQALLQHCQEFLSQAMQPDILDDMKVPMEELVQDETHIYKNWVLVPKRYHSSYLKFENQQEYRNR